MPAGSARATTRAGARVVALCMVATSALTGAAYADAPDYAWSFVSRTGVPEAMHPGEKIPVVVVLRNDGTQTWRSDETADGAHPVRLATTAPRERASAFASADPTWLWSGGRRIRMLTPQVAPGEEARFAFTFTAPERPSYPEGFTERFAPVAEGVAWMDAATIDITTTVAPLRQAVPPIPNPAVPEAPCRPSGPQLNGPRAPSGDDVVPAAIGAGYSFGVPIGALSSPAAVTFDTVGKLVVADTGNHRVRRLDLDGFELFGWGGQGTASGRFDAPGGVAVSPANGQIYVADTGNDRIQRFSLGGIYLGQFGTSGSAPGQFDGPRGLAFLPDGNLAIADSGNDRVQVTSPAGVPIAVIGSSGSDPGQLRAPAAVAAFETHLFVADTGNDRVQRFRLADGRYAGAWGGPGAAAGCMSAPAGIVAGRGGVWVSDTGHDRLQHFTRSGVLLETWSSSGTQAGRVDAPAGLTLGLGSEIIVADAGNDRLHRFNPRTAAAPVQP